MSAERQKQITIVPGNDEAGKTVFCVLTKRSYDIGKSLVRSERDQPFVESDQYWGDGDPEVSSVKYEAELAPFKLGTDVVVVGNLRVPNGNPVHSIDASIEVGQAKKIIRVVGDRKCTYHPRAPVFSGPALFSEMPIQYERSYGGVDARSQPDLPFYYPRNRYGKGVVLKNLPETVEGLQLPNIEDPADLLTPERVILDTPDNWNQQPLPAGLGWFQRISYPRCSFVGAMPGFVDVDTVLREERLGLVPKGHVALSRQFKLPSFDLRFHNGASPGLVFPYLNGDETIRLTNLTPDGRSVFHLPGEVPRIALDIGLGENELRPVLHTVCIRLDKMQVDLVWRGAHEYPGFDWLPEMRKMVAQVA